MKQPDLDEARAFVAAAPAPPLGRASGAAVAAHVRACAVLARAGALPSGLALASLLGVSAGLARSYARLATLDHSLVAVIELGSLPAGVAAELARLPDPDDRLLLATLAVRHSWTSVRGDGGVGPIVRMVVRDGRSLADALAARHGIDVSVPAPWSFLLLVTDRQRALIEARAWLAGEEPADVLLTHITGELVAENGRLRACLDRVVSDVSGELAT